MITVERRHLSRALQFAAASLSRRYTIPVFGAVKAVANGSLRFEGSDLDTFAVAELPYIGDAHEGFCLMEPSAVRAALDHGGGTEVALSAFDNKVEVASGQFGATLSTLPADDHPGAELPSAETWGCDIGLGELAQIMRVRAAISTEGTRYYLNGVAVEQVGDWLWRFVATDGHRLMWADVPLPGATGAIPARTIMPRRFLTLAQQYLAKAKGPIRLSYGPRVASNRPGETLDTSPRGGPRIALATEIDGLRLTLASKLIDGTYPDYTRVIPMDYTKLLRCARGALARAVQALTPLASERVRAVKLTITPAKGKQSGGASLELKSPELGTGRMALGAEHNLDEPFEIGFNGQYLLDMCNAFKGEELELHFDSAGAPVLFRDPADTAFGAVLMPMRV